MKLPNLKHMKAGTIASLICVVFGVGEVIYGGYLFHKNRVNETNLVQQTFSRSIKGLNKKLGKLNAEAQEKLKGMKGSLSIPQLSLTLDVYKANGTGTIIEDDELNNETNKEDLKHDNELMRKGVIFVDRGRTDSGCDEILGHNMRRGNKLFTKLNTLARGSVIDFTCINDEGVVIPKKYIVIESKEIDSTDFSYGRTYKSTDNLALLTCNRKGTTRWLIMCKEVR